MKIEPVKKSEQPKYPDKYSIEVKKALAEAKPRRWAGKPLVLSLSAAIALGFSGCVENPYVTDGVLPVPAYPSGTMTGETPTDTEYITMGDYELIPVLCADLLIPLFEYGEGTGTIGCVAIAAPSFLSEEDAFAILASAFREAGFELQQNTYTLPNANIPVPFVEMFPVDYDNNEIEFRNTELTTDSLIDTDEKSIPVIFISADDLKSWQWTPEESEPSMSSSATGYNIKGAARMLAENNPGLAVFYDPMAIMNFERLRDADGDEWEASYEELRRAAREESETLLKAQANAFVEWLRAEGLMGILPAPEWEGEN